MSRSNAKVKFSIEIERNGKSVEYEVTAEVTPYDPGRTSGPPENCYPPEGGDIEDLQVWYVHEVKCNVGYAENPHPAYCPRCHGKGKVLVREERPELADLVDDEEVLEHLPEEDEPPEEDFIDERDEF